nr:MAG TPA: hypothetical protein [Bacteriophage sp.]
MFCEYEIEIMQKGAQLFAKLHLNEKLKATEKE